MRFPCLVACLFVPVVGLVAVPAPAAAGDPVAHEREDAPVGEPVERAGRFVRPVFDLTVQRPLEAVQLAAGAVVFVPAYPVGWLFGGGRDVYEICLRDPFLRVFATPLGEL